MEVWEVRCDVNCFASVLLKGEYPDYNGTSVPAITRLRGTFTETEQVGDFGYLTAGALVAGKGVVEKFPSALSSEIQFIPIEISGSNEEYFVLNITNIVDALDAEHSEIKYFPSSLRVYRILKYAFIENALTNTWLFKIPELARTDIYATALFKSFIEEEGLSGLIFNKLW